MTRVSLAVLVALPLHAAAQPGFGVPNSPDLTIRTRRIGPGPGRSELTLRMKGARTRHEQTHGDPADGPVYSRVVIVQCDLQRNVTLEPQYRTYFSVALPPQPFPTEAVRPHAIVERDRKGTRDDPEFTIEAVDTGERHRVGTLTALHIVQTTKTASASAPHRGTTTIRDGWYFYPFTLLCFDQTDGEAVLLGSVSSGNEPPARPRVTRVGRPTLGIPVSETIRTVTPRGSWTESTELLQVSDAPIDPALFEIPPNYRPAVPIWGRGYDSSRADTYLNRALLLWETVRDLASRFWH
ncbi:MAG TPA: hypothetical protein VFT47_00550 [Vicinamibacterales bacterium]|nr:hypothetical protein [Vicinamibacterales bacterium]